MKDRFITLPAAGQYSKGEVRFITQTLLYTLKSTLVWRELSRVTLYPDPPAGVTTPGGLNFSAIFITSPW